MTVTEIETKNGKVATIFPTREEPPVTVTIGGI